MYISFEIGAFLFSNNYLVIQSRAYNRYCLKGLLNGKFADMTRSTQTLQSGAKIKTRYCSLVIPEQELNYVETLSLSN